MLIHTFSTKKPLSNVVQLPTDGFYTTAPVQIYSPNILFIAIKHCVRCSDINNFPLLFSKKHEKCVYISQIKDVYGLAKHCDYWFFESFC